MIELEITMEELKKLCEEGNYDIEIETPDGFCDIKTFYIKERVCHYIKTEKNELISSEDHYIQKNDNTWITTKKLRDNDVVLTKNGPEKIVQNLPKQKQKVYDLEVDHPNHRYYTNNIVSHNSGKTILSEACALTKIIKEKESKYDKLILLKPTTPVSDDIGFLPGNVDEKLTYYMDSFHDNFKTLRKMESMKTKTSLDTFEQLKEKGKIEIDCISFLRGRSLNDCIIIVDECQNITQIVMKTILTRVGENCKIILTGDPDQIDRNYLNKYNNGLSYVVDKLKGQSFFGYIKFIQGVRSNVSKICAELL